MSGITRSWRITVGWISVATIANASQLLYYLGWNGWGIAPEIWTLIMLLIASGLGIAMALRYSAVSYGLVLVWAFYGIAFKHPGVTLVSTAAYVGIGLVVLGILLSFIRTSRTNAK